MAYFDYNATTPMNAVARQALLVALDEYWANSSSPYSDSARVHNALESARRKLVDQLKTPLSEIVFTGGATEANNAVVRNLAEQLPKNKQFAISPFEHRSISEPARHYFKGRLTVLEANSDGIVDLDALREVLRTGTVGAVSVMAANNESGVIQPWRDIAQICREVDILYHCDASQWFGKCGAITFEGCDFLVGCGHKFGGPKGVGFLALSDNARGICVQLGGNQESGKRGGTENPCFQP
jgi:cysteine desulfurase